MAKQTQLAVKVLLTIFVLVCAGLLAFNRQFYSDAVVDSFFAFALASAVILQLRIRPKSLDAAAVVLGASLMAFVDFRILHLPAVLMACFSFLGLSSFAAMGIRIVWEDDRRLLLYAWVPAILFVLSEYSASTTLEWTAEAHPRTLDLYLLLFDASLRFQPSFLAGRIYALHPWLHNVSLIAYVGLAIPVTLVFAGRLVCFGNKALSAMLAFLITGPVGVLFYNLFPAAGPHNLFGHKFPFAPLPYDKIVRVILEPVAILGPRNAMPSLHLAWTLLAWWYSRGLSWVERSITLLFFALTAFATLGTGEHWLADLVVAFPFALMIQAICSYSLPGADRQRRAAFLFGLLGTVSWLILLRYCTPLFWASPIVPWGFVIATIAFTVIWQRALDRQLFIASSAIDRQPAIGQHLLQGAAPEDLELWGQKGRQTVASAEMQPD